MSISTLIAWALIVVLAALSLLHVYWVFGGFWPGTDSGSLAQIVVGTSNGRMPPLAPGIFVAVALAAAALLVAWRADLLPALWIAAYWGVIAVFAARGAAAFVPGVFSYAEGTPFYQLNLIVYSPLCLAIAAGMAMLWWMTRPSAP